jgi:3-phenylpropionate/trans-cinnamate dioxygenase ferredoxin reductase subunit
MTDETEPAVIVGAGQAGAHAAVALRQAGHAGRIVLIGDEVERPHERPPLSKQMLTEVVEPSLSYFHPAPHYAERNIETRFGTAVEAIDPALRVVHLGNGERLPFASLLLATGGRARCLDIPGAERVLYLRTLDDARLLRSRLRPGATIACIGAGVIGLEIASSATARDCRVTVIEAGPAVMGRSLPPVVATWLHDLHVTAGVRLQLSTAVEAITAAGVACANGTFVEADIVVAGIGMVRNTTLAEAAGLAVDQGIEVDEFCRTSSPGIYAAGDVAAFWVPRLRRRVRWETWRHAQDHGAAAGRSMAGQFDPYDAVPWFWTDQHGRNLQLAGEAAGRLVLRGAPGDEPFSAWFIDDAGCLAGVIGVDSPREVRAAQSLIRDRRHVDPRLLEDPAVPARRLLAA